MNLRDRALIGALTVALIAFSVTALAPTLHSSGDAVEPNAPVTTGQAYVEGVLGRATNASPFGARSAADRALVSLLFRGLVKLGPGSSIVGDLAVSWEVDGSGSTWTFHLRPDQRWQDGEPITADDVAFTIGVLSDPSYTGPGAESLGKAIHDLQPNLNKHTVKSDVKVAHQQTEADLKASSAAHTSS